MEEWGWEEGGGRYGEGSMGDRGGRRKGVWRKDDRGRRLEE